MKNIHRVAAHLAAGVTVVLLACTSPTTVPADFTGKCNSLLTSCGGTCTDLQTDPKNCNGCGNACKSGEVCVKGVCQFDCIDGTTKCGDRCFDLQADPNNCGACAKKCADGLFCAAGKCVARCESAGLTTCGPPVLGDGGADAAVADAGDAGPTFVTPGGCADLSKDPKNCGACGVQCGGGKTCVAGTCIASDEIVCNGVAVKPLFDDANCGRCGNACGAGKECFVGECKTSNKYSSSFQQGVSSTAQQCTDFNAWRASLTGTYSYVWLRSSLDGPGGGAFCTGATANTICNALRTYVQGNPSQTFSCGGRTWSVGTCSPGVELATSGAVCNCAAGGVLRPCIQNLNWGGGVSTTSCNAPTQTLTVSCGN
jgi:hypothetical protein